MTVSHDLELHSVKARLGKDGKCYETRVAQMKGEDVFQGVPHKDVLVFIPGNPGVPDFYLEFLAEMRKAHGKGLGCVCIGLFGHTPSRENYGRLFNVEEQVELLGDVLRQIKEANPSAALHLGGHSVGAYFSLQLSRAHKELATVLLLFPTIAHIARAPNGRMAPLLLPGMRHLAAGTASLLGCLPTTIREGVASWWVGSKRYGKVAASLPSLYPVLNFLTLANSEFATIRDLDRDALREIKDKVVLYYGVDDGWVPTSYRYEAAEVLQCDTSFATPPVVLDTTGAPHAYVLTHSAEVAARVAPYLNVASG
eukprot:Sspe_Gene.77337::Locus_48311_Transcript_1_1_Confidence_1.000_Length_1472::g.77337::m.77337